LIAENIIIRYILFLFRKNNGNMPKIYRRDFYFLELQAARYKFTLKYLTFLSFIFLINYIISKIAEKKTIKKVKGFRLIRESLSLIIKTFLYLSYSSDYILYMSSYPIGNVFCELRIYALRHDPDLRLGTARSKKYSTPSLELSFYAEL